MHIVQWSEFHKCVDDNPLFDHIYCFLKYHPGDFECPVDDCRSSHHG